ncbi:MAG TPA: hypothetical protein VJH65_01400 [Candidatus Nanoarchaeia archaeon]|nr:hypothetical protein [Candidatus Nanoarchaeia archaeon]
MKNQDLVKKITAKKEFSQLPEIDVKLAIEKFDRPQYTEEEKIKLTRDLLRKTYSVFASQKLLNLKNKNPEWILRKHISTKERLSHYPYIYNQIFRDFKGKVNIIDLGCGVNGFSYNFMKDFINTYTGIEAVGQLVNLNNYYFKNNKLDKKSKVYHLSLFDLEKIHEIIEKTKPPRVILLFKVVDSLEILKRDYSKILIREAAKNSEMVVVSFATRSLTKRKKFKASRKWLIDFIYEDFKVVKDFEVGGERYVAFEVR